MPKKIKKKPARINQSTPAPMDISNFEDASEISNEEFYDSPTLKASDIAEENTSKDIGGIAQKTWADIIYPFTSQLNLYVVIPIIIYTFSIISGHLSTWKEFGFVSLVILICSSILFIANRLK